MCDFVVSTMPADGLAPLCDIISADNVMLLLEPCTLTGSPLKRLHVDCIDIFIDNTLLLNIKPINENMRNIGWLWAYGQTSG